MTQRSLPQSGKPAPAARPGEPAAESAADRDHRAVVIGTQVIRALGQPADRFRVHVRRLWEDHYRVNVLVGGDVTSTTIAHSYFLVADGEGTITAATPAITRRYREGEPRGD
jgi:hypothetical protein